ncbi:MAG: hypothetical protein Kow00123_27050 [Anaerolineales bacterium]
MSEGESAHETTFCPSCAMPTSVVVPPKRYWKFAVGTVLHVLIARRTASSSPSQSAVLGLISTGSDIGWGYVPFGQRPPQKQYITVKFFVLLVPFAFTTRTGPLDAQPGTRTRMSVSLQKSTQPGTQ